MEKTEYLFAIKTAEELVGQHVYSMCIKAIGLEKTSTEKLKEVIVILYNELHKKIEQLKYRNRPYQIAIRFNRATQHDKEEYQANIKQIAVFEYKATELYNILMFGNVE